MNATEITALVQALGAPLVVLLIWVKWNQDHKKNGKSIEPVLREIVTEMRSINGAMGTSTRAMEGLLERLIMHDASSQPAIEAVGKIQGGVERLLGDMEARQRGMYRP